MRSTEQPGFLDDSLGDQQVPLPDHLSWDALGDQISPPEPKSKRPKFFWWPLLLIGLGLGAIWLGQDQTPVPSPADPMAETTTAEAPASDSGTETTPSDGLNTSLATSLDQRNSPTNPTKKAQSTPGSPAVTLPGAAEAAQSVSATALPETTGVSPPVSATTMPGTTEVARPFTKPTASPVPPQQDQGNEAPKDAEDLIAQTSASPERGAIPVQSLPVLPVSVLDVPATETSKDYPVVFKSRKTTHYLQLLVGTADFSGAPQQLEQLNDPQIGLHFQLVDRRGWQFSAGLQLGRQTWRSELYKEEETLLYRPGTVDSIYRNITTGEEEIVTVDSINGTLITEFVGYGQLNTLSVPLTIGRSWRFLGGQLSLSGGLAPTLVFGRSGRSLDQQEAIVALDEQVMETDFFLEYLGAAQYARPLSGRLEMVGGAELGLSGKQLFSGLGGQASRKRLQINLGLRLRISR